MENNLNLKASIYHYPVIVEAAPLGIAVSTCFVIDKPDKSDVPVRTNPIDSFEDMPFTIDPATGEIGITEQAY